MRKLLVAVVAVSLCAGALIWFLNARRAPLDPSANDTASGAASSAAGSGKPSEQVASAGAIASSESPTNTPREARPNNTASAPVADPRLDFDSPFRNIRPHVQYVGDAKCADCHLAISDTYHAHPMGRSAVLA
ncbi:MAG: hypothetical protein ACK5OB_07880, partial [Pirellula sp.]